MTTDAPAPASVCPICAARGLRRTVYALKAFDVIECARCGGLQRNPLPSATEMEGYYSDPRYIEGGYFADSPSRQSPEAEIFREALGFLAARRTAARSPAAGRLLDVGAGSGAFLELAVAQGWDCDGVELSPELAARAALRSGARIVQGDFVTVELDQGTFDAVTMWDVLEHTSDPGAFLDRTRSILAPGGVLVVFTIDAASLFNTVADLAWRLTAHRLASPLELLYDKRHNHYFSARTLETLLGGHGLRIERTQTHRAHLGRWLSEPASALVLAGAEVIDLMSVAVRRPYRQLLYCVAQ